MAEITYQQESLADVRAAGVEELLVRHWAEIARYPDIPLDVDWTMYEMAEAQGLLRIYSARNESLIGYACYIVRPAPHYKGSLQAVQDVLYLAPEYRGRRTGLNLIRYADMRLGAEGVQVVMHHSKVAHPIDAALTQLGYECVETIWAKRLD